MRLFRKLLFALCISAIAPLSSLADDGLLNCFEAAEYTSEAVLACSTEILETCILSGTDQSGNEAEIACFQQYEQAVRDVAQIFFDQFSNDPSEIRAGIKSAAFRRSFKVAEANCVYYEELNLVWPENAPSESDDASYSLCMADFVTRIFWLVAVHEQLDFGIVE